MNFTLYSTGKKVSGSHSHQGKQIDRDISEESLVANSNSIIWNTHSSSSNRRSSTNALSHVYGLDEVDLDSILNISVVADDGNEGEREEEEDDMSFPSAIEEETTVEGEQVSMSIVEEEELEQQDEEEEEDEGEVHNLKEEYHFLKELLANNNLVSHTFQLPPLPESDTETLFTKIPNHFGSKYDDVEWDRFATEYYCALKTLNCTVTYWLELIVQHRAKWEALVAVHLKKVSSPPSVVDGFEIDEKLGEAVHFSCRECLKLDPFNLNTGHHFCYFYWIKVIATSMACYRDLMVYFLKGNTIQNFTKVVRMPGFKNKETGAFCPPHQTSMAMSMCVELNRLRLVCRSFKLWPTSPEAYLYYLNEDMCALNYAKSHSLIRSHYNRRSPMVVSLKLASCIKANENIPPELTQYRMAVQQRQVEYQKEAEKNKSQANEMSSREIDHMDATLFHMVQEQGVLPVSTLEELCGGLVWRLNTFWHTSAFGEYLDLLLDKIALYFLGPHTIEVMDDPLFRLKVSEEHEKYSVQEVQKALLSPSSPTTVVEMEVEEQQEEEDEEETEINSQFEETTESPTITTASESNNQQQLLGVNFLMHLETDLKAKEIFILNQDFLAYTNSLIAEIHLNKYYRNRYPQVKWQFIGETPEEKDFKLSYFLAMRAFFKYWARHRRVVNTDMIRDDAATKYSRMMTTQCEFNWFKYYTSVVLKDTSKLISTTNSKLIQVLRPFEKEALADMAGEEMRVLFDFHRVDPRHRGYGDLLRFMLAGSVFAASIPEFTLDASKYVLHHEQTLSNWTWFQQDNFPFIWYWGGRYHVYCNGILWYVFDLPYDLVSRIKSRRAVDPDAYYTKEQVSDTTNKGRTNLATNLENECASVNRANDFDNHAYLGPNIEDTQYLLYQELFASDGEEQQLASEEEEEEEADFMWFRYSEAASRNLAAADYECLTSLAMEEMENIQDRCLPESDFDNGDTLYDTLALWAFMTQENYNNNPKLAKAVMEGIHTSCDILIQKANSGTQKDFPLLQITPQVLELKEMVDLYERNYI